MYSASAWGHVPVSQIGFIGSFDVPQCIIRSCNCSLNAVAPLLRKIMKDLQRLITPTREYCSTFMTFD